MSAIPGGSYSLFRTLSPAGRLTSLVYPSGRIVDYVYDVPCGCKVQSIRTTLSGPSLSVLENLAYEPFSGAQAMSFGNGGAVANVSSLDGRLLHANVGRPGRRDYTYDADGRLASVSAPASPGFSRSFSYDSLGQLSRAEGSFGNGFLEYGYDKAGNRLLETRAIGTSAGTADDLVFAYNQLGELARVQKAASGAVVVSFAYNALGQRVKKGPNPAATTSATMFFYDFEGNLLGEIDSTGAIVREYIYRGNSRVGFIEGGNLYYFHNDTTGNPVLVTGANRQVVWEAIYEPFGLAFVNPASTIENNFRFQGQYFDEETGLHYNFHRYYDPGSGRYITPDPIGLAGGINLYGYAGNDPVGGVDPEGKWVQVVGVIGGIASLGYMAYNIKDYFDKFYVKIKIYNKKIIEASNDPIDVEKYKAVGKACYEAGKGGVEAGLAVPGVHLSPPPTNAIELIGAGVQTYIQNGIAQ